MLPHLLDGVRVPRPCGGRPRTRPDALLADKAYCARDHRLTLTARGIKVVIPEQPASVLDNRWTTPELVLGTSPNRALSQVMTAERTTPAR